jgi:hypothetical protein
VTEPRRPRLEGPYGPIRLPANFPLEELARYFGIPLGAADRSARYFSVKVEVKPMEVPVGLGLLDWLNSSFGAKGKDP